MSEKPDSDLRQKAVCLIEDGRSQIGLEVGQLKIRLSPVSLVRKWFDRHVRGAVIMTFASGIAVGFLAFRRRKQPVKVQQRSEMPKLLGMVIRAGVPILLKAVISGTLKKKAAQPAETTSAPESKKSRGERSRPSIMPKRVRRPRQFA